MATRPRGSRGRREGRAHTPPQKIFHPRVPRHKPPSPHNDRCKNFPPRKFHTPALHCIHGTKTRDTTETSHESYPYQRSSNVGCRIGPKACACHCGRMAREGGDVRRVVQVSRRAPRVCSNGHTTTFARHCPFCNADKRVAQLESARSERAAKKKARDNKVAAVLRRESRRVERPSPEPAPVTPRPRAVKQKPLPHRWIKRDGKFVDLNAPGAPQ